MYVAEQKNEDAYIVCASIQSVTQNLDRFKPDYFGYVIIDECHHGTAETYRKILGYFKPKFTLGLILGLDFHIVTALCSNMEAHWRLKVKRGLGLQFY